MTEIINDLLTLVRLDQKEIPVTFNQESLNSVIEDIVKGSGLWQTIKI